jgi:Zn-dependent M28 family amino/carboxypeptidase
MANPNAAIGGRGAGLNGPPFQVVKFQASRPPAVPTITAGIELTNAVFQGERSSGAQVFEGATANAKLESFEFNAEKKLSLRIATSSERNHAENVIAILEGGDPVLKNEFVVVTAHLDHVGLSNPDSNGDGISNGADDDASGCAAIMAMARTYAAGAAKGIRPKRSMIFLWVGGEEKGLWGSQYFNQFPPVDITKVVANLNMDMIGRSKTPGYADPPSYKLVEKNEVFVVGPDISSTELGKMLETVNSGYQKLTLNHFYDVTVPDATHDNLGPSANGQRIFYRSDHYNFAKMGIPIIFFTTGLHPDYHRVTDSPEKIDYQQMLAITKTVAATGWVLSNALTPPKLNAKLPDQLINDMKTVKEQGWGKLTPVIEPLPGMPF